MNVLPELRDQLTGAMAGRRRVRLPMRVMAVPVAVAVAALVVSFNGDVEREAPPQGSPPLPAATIGCDRANNLDRVFFGSHGDEWRAGAVEVGPLTFVGLGELADAPAWRFAKAAEHARHEAEEAPDVAKDLLDNGRDRYAAATMHVLVEPRRKATLTIDRSARGTAGLLTRVTKLGGYRASDGRSQVTFPACPAIPPQSPETPGLDRVAFPLAFVVEGARCVPIIVTPEGGRPQRAVVSFGAGRCG